MHIVKNIFFWVGIVLTVALLFVAAFEYTSQSGFCVSCHNMDKPYDAWRQASHWSVACVDCHLPKSITARIKAKVSNGGRELYNNIFKSPKLDPGQGRPGDSTCLECHSRGKYTLTRNGIRITHREHTRMKTMTCSLCHWESAHKRSTFVGRKKMARCMDCHKKEKLKLACNGCHKR